MNLVLNSRRAMAAGGGLLRVAAVAADRPRPPAGAVVASTERAGAGHWLVIAVSDSGTGMSASRLASLFKPFVAGSTRSGGARPSPHGNGLGLVVCRQLVEQAGGMLWAESAPGEGATFTVALPAAEK